ncbi:hypothetical protein [Burkholderia vietnamiensis]|uniref:hypothetical protein n=1 Tax=Burkholderia vietnamiensis TaxID=60552 RepID=UPI001594947D|nr:hypothetical protein [Burkholderia vietnamiensis]
MNEPILSREEVEALAHRICVRYFHSENIHLRQYTFGITTLEQFAQAYEAALLEKLCGEPVAWQVRRISGNGAPLTQWENCTKELHDETLQTGRYAGYENGPRCEVQTLYALNRSKA